MRGHISPDLLKKTIEGLEKIIAYLHVTNKSKPDNEKSNKKSSSISSKGSKDSKGSNSSKSSRNSLDEIVRRPKKTLFPEHKYLDLSSRDEIDALKKKYRQLARKNHPDKCKPEDYARCNAKFQDISNEYMAIRQRLNFGGGKTIKINKTKKNKTFSLRND